MKRRLFALASLLSLLILTVTIALWVTSYWFICGYEWDSGWGRRCVQSNAGGIQYIDTQGTTEKLFFSDKPGFFINHATPRVGKQDDPVWSIAGFEFTHHGWGQVSVNVFRVPFWAVACASAILPVRRWVI